VPCTRAKARRCSKRFIVYPGLIIALLSLLPGAAAAQRGFRMDTVVPHHAPQDGTIRGSFGVRGGVFAAGGDAAGPLVGIDGWFPMASGFLAFTPSLDFAFADDWFVIIGGDLCIVVAPRSPVRLWVGGGGSLIDRTAGPFGQDGTDFAPDLLLGIDTGDDELRFFVEAKAMFGDETRMSFVAGLRF
jgi:hypothetical protein